MAVGERTLRDAVLVLRRRHRLLGQLADDDAVLRGAPGARCAGLPGDHRGEQPAREPALPQQQSAYAAS